MPHSGFGVFHSPFAVLALFSSPAVLTSGTQPPRPASIGAFYFPCSPFPLIFHRFHFPLPLPLLPPLAPVHNHYHHNLLEVLKRHSHQPCSFSLPNHFSAHARKYTNSVFSKTLPTEGNVDRFALSTCSWGHVDRI